MERIAVTGPQSSGKSPLIRALGGDPQGASRAHTVYSLEDELLVRLAQAERSEKSTPVKVSFEEIESGSLGALRQLDGIVIVVRVTSEPDAGSTARVAAGRVQEVSHEMIRADLDLVEGALARLRKSAASGDRVAGNTIEAAGRLVEALEARDLPAAASIASGSPSIPKEWGLLCTKVPVVVVDIDEEATGAAPFIEEFVRDRLGDSAAAVIASPLEIEAELEELDPEDAAEMAASYSIEEPIKKRLSRAVLDALGLLVFYTANDKEARAWTLRRGSTAIEAAGRIHSDMERGFIRAEVIPAEELLAVGSLKEARRSGSVRVEGKDYAVRTGDVLWVRFNV